MLTILLLMIIVAISLNLANSSTSSTAAFNIYTSEQQMTMTTRWLWTRATGVVLICSLILIWECSLGQSLSDQLGGVTATYLFNGYLYTSTTITFFNFIVVLMSSSFIFMQQYEGLKSTLNDLSFNSEPKEREQREISIFLVSMLLGSIILSMSTDILTFLLGLELQSYSVYILAASGTRDTIDRSEPSAFAGLKYFLLGAMSSALVFMGLAILYLFSGTTSLSYNFTLASSLNNDIIYCYLGYLLVYVGLLWKIAAAPVHSWSIDVYDALPNRIAAIVSLVPKVAIIAILIQLTGYLVSLFPISLYPINDGQIMSSMLYLNFSLVICLSLIIGAVMGLYQSRIKRLLAYSSTLNMGFIFIALSGSNLGESDYIVVMYLLQYIFATGGIWLCINSLRVNNLDLTLTQQLQGIGNINPFSRIDRIINGSTVEEGAVSARTPFLALSLTILILSVAGIPPMVGFFAKFEVIYLAVMLNNMNLAFIAIVASLISTVYYLRVVKNIWFLQHMTQWHRSGVLGSSRPLLSFGIIGLISKETPIINNTLSTLPSNNNNNLPSIHQNFMNMIPRAYVGPRSNTLSGLNTLSISFITMTVLVFWLQFPVLYAIFS